MSFSILKSEPGLRIFLVRFNEGEKSYERFTLPAPKKGWWRIDISPFIGSVIIGVMDEKGNTASGLQSVTRYHQEISDKEETVLSIAPNDGCEVACLVMFSDGYALYDDGTGGHETYPEKKSYIIHTDDPTPLTALSPSSIGLTT